jgi:hypothetical protein
MGSLLAISSQAEEDLDEAKKMGVNDILHLKKAGH